MEIILNYNFDIKDIDLERPGDVFEFKRRDSTFACVFEVNNKIYAIRDHIGIVPVYYRRVGDEFKFSTNLSDLVLPDDELTSEGVDFLLGLNTPRIMPLISSIKIVPPGSLLEIDKTSGESKIKYQYQMKPVSISSSISKKELIGELDRLFMDAVKRLVKFDKVGLFLSGGIDSGLIGLYLKKLGVSINAYTSSPWGEDGSEVSFSKINASVIGVDNHFFDFLNTDNYRSYYNLVPKLFKIPHGTSASIGTVSLWENTDVSSEQQIFFGQNTDTVMCSMSPQYMVYFSSFLPGFIRKKLGLSSDSIAKDHVFIASNKVLNEYPDFYDDIFRPNTLSKVQVATLAGIYLGHTPRDSEEFTQLPINNGILASNPYYDVDLMEFCLGIPMKFRFGKSSKSKFLLALDKNPFKQLAIKHFPKEVVFRKKSFLVPFNRDEKSRKFLESLPTSTNDVELSNESRLSLGVLKEWCQINGCSFQL